ncbi:MAG: HlyD family secretion protein [Bacteroidales bacterium]|jgi:HlyD family secretion protein|nr:HlyD family secretion protein [Bacteroidales bacterium]
MPEKDTDKIDLVENSSEIQEIMGHVPHSIIRVGITVIFGIIAVIIAGSCFFKYPDIITGTVVITTENPPAPIAARTSGKIDKLMVNEATIVTQGEHLAILENTANYNDIVKLKGFVDQLDVYNRDMLSEVKPMNLKLGDLQNSYSAFSKSLKDYINFIKLDYYTKKIASVSKQTSDYKMYFQKLKQQLNISTEQMVLYRKQFKRDSMLHVKKVYSTAEFEKAHQQFLSQKQSYQSLVSSVANTQMQMNQLEQQLLDLKLKQTESESNQIISLTEAVNNLKSSILNWEKKYLIVSPIDGKVSFTKFWSENQNVQSGEIVLTVIPHGATNIIGKVNVSATGSGKIKVGQHVNIKLDNYPYMTYGMMRGTIKNISMIPEVTKDGTVYISEVEIPDTLISNYGTKLKFSQSMSGQAEIITENRRLIERFLSPLRALWNKGTE